jgi:hypothetical protein
MALRPFMTQGVVPQTLLNSFTAGNAPQGGVAMTAPMTPRTMAAPAAAATQGPDSLAQMTRLLGGDLSGSLTSGDKLLALSGLLRSATRSGRRAGITPQQVIGQLQQQKLAELQNRMAVEQMQTARTQQQEQRRLRSEFLATLPEQERRFASFLGDTALQEYAVKRREGPELTTAEKQLIAAGIDPKSSEGQRILRNVAASGGIIAVSGPKGTTYVQAGDVAGINGSSPPPPASTTSIPAEAEADLRAGRGTPAQFDRIFGEGAAARVLGGGSGNATGGFR